MRFSRGRHLRPLARSWICARRDRRAALERGPRARREKHQDKIDRCADSRHDQNQFDRPNSASRITR